MQKSLKKTLSDVQDVVESLGLKADGTLQVSYMVGHGVSIQLTAIELVRVSRALNVPRSKIAFVDDGKDAIHIEFTARGIKFCGVIFYERREHFLKAMGVDPVAIVSSKMLRLSERSCTAMIAVDR